MVLATFALGLALTLQNANPSSVNVGSDTYAPGPTLRLGRMISNELFSQDERFFSFFDESVEESYAAARERIRTGSSDSPKALVRVDIRRGIREVVYRPSAEETLMSIEPVGTGGDLLCTLAVGVPRGDLVTWRAIYCPIGAAPRLIVDRTEARSFGVAASKTERKVFILICDPEKPVRYLFITPTQTLPGELPVTAFQGGFFLRTTDGNPIVGLQGPAPDYSPLGNFELRFADGTARAAPSLGDVEQEEPKQPLIEYLEEVISTLEPRAGDAKVKNILAKAAGESESGGSRTIIQGAISLGYTSSTGLAFSYLTSDGYFLREMVKLAPPREK